ncbi:AAA family ATPase [Nonomuraea thailandensis]
MDALSVAVAANLPVLLWGSPGTGKTSAVLALGERLGLPVEVVVGSIREPSDFAGLPVLRDGETWFAPPRWASRLASAGRGILFLDELTTAPPAVQAAMLRVVLERAVGDLALPPAVRIVAAANPPEQAADGWDLSAPLANRLVHLDWTVSAESVAEGFIGGFPRRRVLTRRWTARRWGGPGRWWGRSCGYGRSWCWRCPAGRRGRGRARGRGSWRPRPWPSPAAPATAGRGGCRPSW